MHNQLVQDHLQAPIDLRQPDQVHLDPTYMLSLALPKLIPVERFRLVWRF